MARNHWLTLYRAAVLLAVLASSLLYIHYLAPADSDVCGDSGGCEAVRRSGFSYFGTPYVNIPLFGMVAYSVLFVLALGSSNARRSNWLRVLSGVGGVFALLFVIWQAVLIGAFCWLCIVVDSAAVCAAFLAHAAHLARDDQRTVLRPWAWGGLLASAAGLPLLWYAVRPLPPVPGPIHDLYKPGKINIIGFSDFQCPHCRKLHPMLKELIKEHGDQIAYQRLHMPLGLHTEAGPAARAALCGAAQGQETAMADLLFEGRLGDEAYLNYAEQLKLDLPLFKACLKDPKTQATIDADVERFRQSGLRGLPTTFVGEERISGARPVAVFQEAIQKAAEKNAQFALSGGLFIGLSAALSAGLLVFGRARKA